MRAEKTRLRPARFGLVGGIFVMLVLIILPAQPSAQTAEGGWNQPTPMHAASRRPCPQGASAAAAARIAFDVNNFEQAAESSAEALDCPDQLRLSEHCELLVIQAISLHTEWRRLSESGKRPLYSQLLDAASALETGFALMSAGAQANESAAIRRRAQDAAVYLIPELYNKGLALKQEEKVTAIAELFEAAVKMAAFVPKGQLERLQREAVARAAYYAGMHFQARGEKERGIACFRASIPLDRDLLAGDASSLRANLAIPEDQAVPVYYSLGVLLFNDLVLSYNSKPGEPSPAERTAYRAQAEEAELCLRLGLMLNPTQQELSTVLVEVEKVKAMFP